MLEKSAVVIHRSYENLYVEQMKGLEEFMKEASENKT
jgi:hypothetical protein